MSTPLPKAKPSEMTEEERKDFFKARAAKAAATRAAKKAEAAAAEAASAAPSEPGSVRTEASSRSWKEYTEEERTALYKARAAKAVATKAEHKAADADAEVQRLLTLVEEAKAEAERLKAEVEQRKATAEAAMAAAADLLARNDAAAATPPRSPSPDGDEPKKRTLTPEHQRKMQAGRDIAGFRRIVETMLERVDDPRVQLAGVIASGGSPFDLF